MICSLLKFQMLYASLIILLMTPLLSAQDPQKLPSHGEMPPWPAAIPIIIGQTDEGKDLTAWMDPAALQLDDDRLLILVTIQSSSNPAVSSERIRVLHDSLQTGIQSPVRCIVIPVSAQLQFPPTGPAYHTSGGRTAATIWRAISWLAPDLVIDCSDSTSAGTLLTALKSETIPPSERTNVCRIPLSVLDSEEELSAQIRKFSSPERHSPLRESRQKRVQRTSAQCAEQWGQTYGHELKTVVYQPAVAVMARLQRAIDTDDQQVIKEVGKLLEVWMEQGTPAQGTGKGSSNGSMLAGHLVFAAWGAHTGDPRAVQVVVDAANHGFDPDGAPLEAIPEHSEMSDAIFMDCPILTAAGRLTGEQKYVEMALRQLRFIQQRCQRTDGLYRHSPLCEAAWGRGNAFPLLGLALSLSDLDAIEKNASTSAALRACVSRVKTEMLTDFQQHAAALLPYQDQTGMWHQVIDVPGSYREMTATCMIGFAFQRGVHFGWLDSAVYQPSADKAWRAVQLRCDENGVLLDVCTSTGKQKTLQDYLDRTAIYGVDERGGAMALLFAVERSSFEERARAAR